MIEAESARYKQPNHQQVSTNLFFQIEKEQQHQQQRNTNWKELASSSAANVTEVTARQAERQREL